MDEIKSRMKRENVVELDEDQFKSVVEDEICEKFSSLSIEEIEEIRKHAVGFVFGCIDQSLRQLYKKFPPETQELIQGTKNTRDKIKLIAFHINNNL